MTPILQEKPVKCATSDGGPYAILSNTTTTNCTITGLTNGVTYYYEPSVLFRLLK